MIYLLFPEYKVICLDRYGEIRYYPEKNIVKYKSYSFFHKSPSIAMVRVMNGLMNILNRNGKIENVEIDNSYKITYVNDKVMSPFWGTGKIFLYEEETKSFRVENIPEKLKSQMEEFENSIS